MSACCCRLPYRNVRYYRRRFEHPVLHRMLMTNVGLGWTFSRLGWFGQSRDFSPTPRAPTAVPEDTRLKVGRDGWHLID